MNYRHPYHAGNFADVLKHAALVSILLHLRKKEKPFAVIDSHAGRGVYDIAGAEAAKTGEAKNGIVRLLTAGALAGVLQTYGDIVRGLGDGLYPGSSLIAAKLLRAKDRLVAIEKHPEEFAALAGVLAKFPRTRAIAGDGYKELQSLLPPPERRGLVLIDPPYESDDEFLIAVRALVAAYQRFATGIFLFWYPLKERGPVDATAGEILNAGIDKVLRVELDVGMGKPREGEGKGTPLSATGILVLNPPYGFDKEISAILPFLVHHLGRGAGARFRLEWLAGEST